MGNASRTIKSVKKTMSLAAYTDSCERMIFMKKIKITKAGIKYLIPVPFHWFLPFQLPGHSSEAILTQSGMLPDK